MRELNGSHVLVIGGAGFIGSTLVDLLLREPVARVTVFDNFVRGTRANLARAAADERLRVIEGSILDREALTEALTGVAHVVHHAALWLGECLNDPRAANEVNTTGTFNVAEAAIAAGVKRLVYSSSASVYGDARTAVMDEDHPFDNTTFYGATKIAGEQMLRALHHQHGLDYVALRYFNAYGPRMDDKGVYVSVIAKALDRIDNGLPPIVYGDGSQAYDFIHVADIARSNVLALKAEATDRAYNVATGVSTSIADVVRILLQATGSDLEPEFLPEGQSFVTRRLGGIEAAARELGFTAQIALEDGLRDVVEWRRAAAAV